MYKILCEVSGGRTGCRQSFLKESGEVVIFQTEEAALEECSRLTDIQASPYATAYFTYRPVCMVFG